MGCSSNLSNAHNQNELEYLIKIKRKVYDKKLREYIMSSINENINILSKGNFRIGIKENPKEVILQKFVDGISEVQKRLEIKDYNDFREISLIIEEYFRHASDKDCSQIQILRKQMKDWFDSHV